MKHEGPFRIVAFAQCYNEMETGNLPRWVDNVKKFCDAIAVYDDGSTDGSYEYLVPFADVLIRSKTNDWKNELFHKKKLVQEVQEKLKPDFIFWLDIDEVASRQLVENIQDLCWDMRKNKYDGVFFKEINLWKSEEEHRVDSHFDQGLFCRLWDCGASKRLSFDVERGLHKKQYPNNIFYTKNSPHVVIHYGFSSEQIIKNKYDKYKRMGQKGYALERIHPDSKAVLEKVNPDWFFEKKQKELVQ